MENRIQIARKAFFSAAHFYQDPDLSPEENLALYGGATQVHGHDYTLICTLEGPIDPVTGLVVNLVDVDKELKSLTEPLDQKPLNSTVERFKTVIPSTENLALYFYEELEKIWPPGGQISLVSVRVEETPELWAEYPAGPNIL